MRNLGLSPRQREVAEQLIQAKTDREIGESLGLNLRTVKAHMGKILEKLGTDNRVRALVLLHARRLDMGISCPNCDES